jgi:hypothetical protein
MFDYTPNTKDISFKFYGLLPRFLNYVSKYDCRKAAFSGWSFSV